MVVSTNNEEVAPQVATNTGTSGGSAGNNTTTGGAGPIASPTPVVAPKGFRSALQLMLQGWQELIPSDSTLQSSIGSLTEASVLAKLQGYLVAYTDLDTNVTGTRQARAQVASQLPEVRAYYAALKASLANAFGPESPQLVKFGLKPKQARAPLSGKQLAVKAAKAEATRSLRGTTGPAKKAALKSGPMQVTVGPVSPGQSIAPAAAGTGAASTAPPDPASSAASPAVAGK
jgi:hypothetical protein